MSDCNVVIVNDYASVNGGAAKVAIESACGLAQAGWNVIYFAAVGPVDQRLSDARVTVHLTDQPDLANQSLLGGATTGLWNARAARELHSLLTKLSPDNTIVHFHGWVKALTGSVVRDALDAHFPVVMTMHDYFLACPNGGFYNFQTHEKCPARPLSRQCLTTQCDKRGYHHKLWRVVRQFGNERMGIPGDLKNLIAVSHYSRQILQPYLSAEARVEVIPNPIANQRVEAVIPSLSNHCLFVGRLDPEKGCLLLAQAAREIGMPIRFVGTGPEEELIRQANPEAEILGWLAPTEVVREIRSARFLVLPSLWHETQGMVVAEAAAHGVPSVVPDRCAAADMVQDRVNGVIFRSGDKHSLSHALQEFSSNQFVDNLGKGAFTRFWSDPDTLEKHVRTLSDYYARILSSERAGLPNMEREALYLG